MFASDVHLQLVANEQGNVSKGMRQYRPLLFGFLFRLITSEVSHS